VNKIEVALYINQCVAELFIYNQYILKKTTLWTSS